jgi:hypothetical protein
MARTLKKQAYRGRLHFQKPFMYMYTCDSSNLGNCLDVYNEFLSQNQKYVGLTVIGVESGDEFCVRWRREPER